MNSRFSLSVCLFVRILLELKRIFNGNINYIPYVILSKQVCYFEFRIYKSLLCLYIVVVSKYSTIYELIIQFNSLVLQFQNNF